MKSRLAPTHVPVDGIRGLILTGPGERDQRKFFDEMIPALDAATADAVHLASIGDPVAAGANFRKHFIDDTLKTSTGKLSDTWARNVDRWRDANIAVAEQVEAALTQFGIRRTELPCIVFPLAIGGGSQRVVLRIPPALFAEPEGRSALGEALVAELSAERLRRIMRSGPGRRTSTLAQRWASHVRATSRRLQTAAKRLSKHSRSPATGPGDAGGSPEMRHDPPRLVVDTRTKTVQLDGVDYAVSHQPWLYVKALAGNSPGWVKGRLIPGMKRPRDARRRLPPEILGVIESGRLGHRLTVRAEVAH